MNKGDVKMEKLVKTEKRVNFFDICDDPSYFEREDNNRIYIICVKDGFIPLSMIDKDTKFIDLHCKCGMPAVYSPFTEEEILSMIDERVESRKNEKILKETLSSIGMI